MKAKITLCFAFFCCRLFAVELPFDRACPVFHDNDDHRDVYTEEFLMALAHLGEIKLVGLTTTYGPNAREYELFVKGRAQIVETARRSGFKNLPDPQAGTGARLTRPASSRVEDTKPLNLAASRTLIEAARKAPPEKPLVFLAGGQLTVAADAWLLAPDIVDRMVVAGLLGVPRRDYNASLDAWAWTIVVSKFRVFAVPFGSPKQRGMVFLKAAEVPKARIRAELPQEVPLFHWMFEKRHPSNPGPDEHDYDGQAAIALMRPEYITKVQRWRPDGILPNGDAKLVRDDRGPVIEALDAEQSIASQEFWRAVKAVAAALPKPVPERSRAGVGLPPLRVSDNQRFLVTDGGKPFQLRMDKITGPKVKAWWFNPRNGRATVIGEFPNTGERQFFPPGSGENQDWVLDDTARGFSNPGQNHKMRSGRQS